MGKFAVRAIQPLTGILKYEVVQEVSKMKAPLTKPTVKLIGRDGNAFAVMGRVKQALKHAGADKEYIDKYLSEAISGDYNRLIAVSMKYVEVE